MSDRASPSGAAGHVLVVALGTTVFMWAALYVLAMPAFAASVWVLAVVAAGTILAGGFAAGRLAGASWGGGGRIGLIVGLINLLILGNLLGGSQPGEVFLSALWWILGFIVAAVVLAGAGAALGSSGGRREAVAFDWTGALALVTAFTTLLLLIAGGIVTGLEAGLAVRGWLTANDYPLLLFPLRLMQQDEGVFAEHAHRLWGLLVGLSAILLAVRLWRVEPRRWVGWLGVVILLAVIVQGTLGGTRVTEQSLVLAILHGIFGQLVFATMVALAVVASSAYRGSSAPSLRRTAKTDRFMTTLLVGLLVAQLSFGALYRHLHAHPELGKALLHSALGMHILMATVVITVAVFAGGRASTLYAQPALKRWGLAVLVLVSVQLVLGIGALTVVMLRRDEATIPLGEVIMTTAHQAGGAVLLATATALAVWMRRLLQVEERPADHVPAAVIAR